MSASDINVSVHLHAELVRFSANSREVVELALPVGSVVEDLLSCFGFPPEQPIIVGINGRMAIKVSALKDGDRVDLITSMSGGQVCFANAGNVILRRHKCQMAIGTGFCT